MFVSTPKFTKAAPMNVKFRSMHSRATGVFLFGAVLISAAMTQLARAEETYKLTLKDHRFTPSELTVPADVRFLIEVENLDATPAEFESGDLRVEKFVVGGGKITIRMRALKPGTYKFFDDYHPDDAKGAVIAVEPTKK